MKEKERYLSIDVFKALGIIYLLILHHMMWFFIFGDTGGLRYQEALPLIFYFAAKSGLHVLGLQLPLLAGMTFYFWVTTNNPSWLKVIKRALALAGLGFFMNYLAWGWPSVFSWDVLQFVALSMIISFLLIRKRIQGLSFSILAVLGAGVFFFSNLFPFRSLQDNYFYIVLLGDKAGNHYWPFCPWFSIFVLGLFMAKTLQEKNFKKIQLFPVIGILFLGISLFSGHFYPESTIDQVWGHKLFKPSPFFILGVMGFSLIGIPLLEILLKRFAALRLIIQKSGLVFYSYGILWIYLLTTIIGYYVTTNIILEMLQPTFSQAAQLFIFFLLASLTYSYFIGQRIYRFKNRAS